MLSDWKINIRSVNDEFNGGGWFLVKHTSKEKQPIIPMSTWYPYLPGWGKIFQGS